MIPFVGNDFAAKAFNHLNHKIMGIMVRTKPLPILFRQLIQMFALVGDVRVPVRAHFISNSMALLRYRSMESAIPTIFSILSKK